MIVTRRSVLYGKEFLTPLIFINSIIWKPAVAKISVTLTFFLVVCIATSGFAAPKPGLLPGAQEAQRPAKPEVAYADPLVRSTPQEDIL